MMTKVIYKHHILINVQKKENYSPTKGLSSISLSSNYFPRNRLLVILIFKYIFISLKCYERRSIKLNNQ